MKKTLIYLLFTLFITLNLNSQSRNFNINLNEYIENFDKPIRFSSNSKKKLYKYKNSSNYNNYKSKLVFRYNNTKTSKHQNKYLKTTYLETNLKNSNNSYALWYYVFLDLRFAPTINNLTFLDISISDIEHNYLTVIDKLTKSKLIKTKIDKTYKKKFHREIYLEPFKGDYYIKLLFNKLNKGGNKRHLKKSTLQSFKIGTNLTKVVSKMKKLRDQLILENEKIDENLAFSNFYYFPHFSVGGKIDLLDYKKVGKDIHFKHFILKNTSVEDLLSSKIFNKKIILFDKYGKQRKDIYGKYTYSGKKVKNIEYYNSVDNSLLYKSSSHNKSKVYVSMMPYNKKQTIFLSGYIYKDGSFKTDGSVDYRGSVDKKTNFPNVCYKTHINNEFMCANYFNIKTFDIKPTPPPFSLKVKIVGNKITWYNNQNEVIDENKNYYITKKTNSYKKLPVYSYMKKIPGSNWTKTLKHYFPIKSSNGDYIEIDPYIKYKKTNISWIPVFRKSQIYPKTNTRYPIGMVRGGYNVIKGNLNKEVFYKGLELSEGVDKNFYTISQYKKKSAELRKAFESKQITKNKKKKNNLKNPFSLGLNNTSKGKGKYPTKTCPVCAGTGKVFISQNRKTTNTTYSEDDARYYKTTKTGTTTYHRKVKCSRCKGKGKVKK